MELEKIIIKSGDKKFSLTPENARELQKLLSDIFKDDSTDEYLDQLRELIKEQARLRPYPAYPQPLFPYYEPWYNQRPWITWTSSDTSDGNEGATVTYEAGNTTVLS